MRKSFRFLTTVFVCGFFVLSAFLAHASNKGQSYTIKPGVRPQALGGAFVAVADDINAIYYNPAGLATIKQRQVQVTHTDMFGLGIDYNYFAYAQPKFGIAWAQWGASSDFLLGGGDYTDDTYIIAHAFSLDPETSVGVSLRWLKGRYAAPSAIDDDRKDDFTNGIMAESLTDEGYSIDVGALHQVDEMTRVGLAVHDLFGRRETVNSLRGSEEDTFKPRITLGFSRRTSPDFLFTIELDDIGRETVVHVGAEKYLQDELVLRAGMDDDVFTAGFSYYQSNWEFQYAFKNAMSIGLDKTQRYGAIFRF